MISKRPNQVKLAGIQEAKALFTKAGLAFPPIPEELAPHFERRDDWCFSSRPVTHSPYDIDSYVNEATTGTVQDYVLLAHAGHGINSYAIHYYLVRGPLQLFLQVAWGGAYMDKLETTANVNECFKAARELIQAVAMATKRGHLRSGDRLMVVAADFYRGYWVVTRSKKDDKANSEGRRDQRRRPPYEIVAEALSWCKAR